MTPLHIAGCLLTISSSPPDKGMAEGHCKTVSGLDGEEQRWPGKAVGSQHL